MIRHQFATFLIRWMLNSCGLWLAVRLLGTGYADVESTTSFAAFLIAGLIFSIVNAVLRPITVILALPAILLTLGLFIIVVNGLMVYVSLWLAPDIKMPLLNSILTGMLLSLINYIVSGVLETGIISRKQER